MSKGLVQLAAMKRHSTTPTLPTCWKIPLRHGRRNGALARRRDPAGRGDGQGKALALGLADANGVVSSAALLTARYSVMLVNQRMAQGNFKNTSDGLAQSLKTASSEVADIKANLGKLIEKPYIAPCILSLKAWAT